MKNLLLLLATFAFLPCIVASTNAIAAPAQCAVGWPTFRLTSSQKVVPEVKAIQFLLRARGFYPLQPDGRYGPKTVAAVKAFQRTKGLYADGIVGPMTFPKLVQTIQRGARGDRVRAAQILIRDFAGHEAQYPYANFNVDGIFGPQTESAVRDYQNESQVGGSTLITVNGVVTPLTWALFFHSKLDL